MSTGLRVCGSVCMLLRESDKGFEVIREEAIVVMESKLDWQKTKLSRGAAAEGEGQIGRLCEMVVSLSFKEAFKQVSGKGRVWLDSGGIWIHDLEVVLVLVITLRILTFASVWPRVTRRKGTVAKAGSVLPGMSHRLEAGSIFTASHGFILQLITGITSTIPPLHMPSLQHY